MHYELAWMRNVYRYAYLTIDAASSASAAQGFLQQRRPLDCENIVPFLCAPSPSGEAKIGQLYLRELDAKGPQPADILTRGADASAQSHTSKRAWCLQEMLLSTRCLVFTSETLQLRCHSKTQNVGGATHDPEGDLPRLPDVTFHPDALVECGSDRWRTAWQTWYDIVGNYSRRELTNSSDKLIAISGLADLFARIFGSDGSDYLAGLWRVALPADLLWEVRVTTEISLPHRPQGYRAPSWSWASIDGPVYQFLCYNFGEESPRSIVEVVRCTVSLQNDNLPFGPVNGASLVLRAVLFRIRSQSVHADCVHNSTTIVALEPIQLPQRGQKEPGAELSVNSYFDCTEDGDLHELWIIPISRSSYGLGFNGLLVTRADPVDWPGAGPAEPGDMYRRVGFCSCTLVKVHGMPGLCGDLIEKAPRVNVTLV